MHLHQTPSDGRRFALERTPELQTVFVYFCLLQRDVELLQGRNSGKTVFIIFFFSPLFYFYLFIYFKKASILTKLHEKMVCLLFGMCFSCRQTLLKNTASHYSLMKKEKHNIRSWSALLLSLMCG